MIQVQVQIHIPKDAERLRFEINVLSREDANEHERTIAHAVEQWVLGLNERVAAEQGDTLEVEYIGAQHAEERVLKAARRFAAAEADTGEQEQAEWALFDAVRALRSLDDAAEEG